MYVQNRTVDYQDYQNIVRDYKFNKIAEKTLPELINKIGGFIKNHPQSEYGYCLLRDFLLGINLSLNKDIIDSKTLTLHGIEIDKFAQLLKKSDSFNDDSKEEKHRLNEAYVNIVKKIIEASDFQPEDILDSSLISKICLLSVGSQSSSHTLTVEQAPTLSFKV
jgi:hypothetical protein